MNKKFYVYEWYNIDTNEVFYVGKGCGNRYKITSRRNQFFLEYIKNHNTASRIVRDKLTEEEAFKYEKELTDLYRTQNQCQCCLLDGGYGGYSSVWTQEARDYKSKYNPMKDKDIALKNGAKHKRPVIINGKTYDGTVDAARDLGVWENTVLNWCKRGYDTDGNPCRYADEEQKEYTIHKTSSKAILIDGQRFESLREGAKYLGVTDTSPLCKALKANRPYKGHICVYADQQPS